MMTKINSYKILVVDNLLDVVDTICDELRADGHEVLYAQSEAEAIELFTRDNIDFSFVDLRLYTEDPGDISGISLTALFRYLSPNTYIFLVSGFEPSERVRRVMHYVGGVDFIKKDNALMETIRQEIEKVHASDMPMKDVVDLPKTPSGMAQIESRSEATQLAISVSNGQTLFVRASGKHVYSTRTARILDINIERYARQTDIARKNNEDLRFQVDEIGRNLWKNIIDANPEVLTTFIASREKSSPLSLLFESSRDYLRLPLEFMRMSDPDQYLVLRHPVSRFIYGATPKRNPINRAFLGQVAELKILLIASNTEPDIPEVDKEIKELAYYFGSQGSRKVPVRVKVLPTEQATIDQVRRELRKPDYDIIHYAGHGWFNFSSPEESYLSFWRDSNKSDPIVKLKANEFDWLLSGSNVRLIYLSSCLGTASGKETDLMDDDYLGLADSIVQAGVPSVLGYRWPVSDVSAPRLARAFYEVLLEDGRPDVALWQARRRINANNPNDLTWLSPILIHQV